MTLLILSLLSCKQESNGISQAITVVCEPETIDYESTAEPFLQNYCTGCHSSQLGGSKRFGAPETVNLDSYSAAVEWAERSFIRISLDGDMPPGGGISQVEKDQFMQWAFCGTKGAETERYIGSHPAQNQSHAIAVSVQNTEFGPDVLKLSRFIELGGTDRERFGPYLDEYYQLHQQGADFLGYSLYSDPETLVQEVFYDPPIPILHYQEMAGELETLAAIWENGTDRQEWQEWSGSQTYLSWFEIDPHEREEDPLASIWISNSGEERGWHFSQNVILSREFWLREDGYFIDIQQFTGDLPGTRDYFALAVEDRWFELMIEEGSP